MIAKQQHIMIRYPERNGYLCDGKYTVKIYRNMKLSELSTGERAVVVKVNGHGSFRKRIIEMGFVKGKTVKVVVK